MNTYSYVYGSWISGEIEGTHIFHAISGKRITSVSSQGVNFAQVLDYGRSEGGPALRAMTVHERALMLKALARHLLARKDEFYRISAFTGATRADSWVDIEGGIGTLFSFSSIARREFANERFIVEGGPERLSANNTFSARHVLTPKRGVSVHINAFNFPCWGMLEKIAPSLIAGVPAVVKPATGSAYLTEAMVREIVASELLPEGALQLICGRTGDLLDRLTEQDLVTFTGSAGTGRMLKTHPNIVARSIPFNQEADSLNCCILGASVDRGDPEFDLFVKEVAREMTSKAGQKCTAIRRILVPEEKVEPVVDALRARLDKVVIGDPAVDGVRMGPLLGAAQKAEVHAGVTELAKSSELLIGGGDDFDLVGDEAVPDAFYPPTLLYCADPLGVEAPHAVEAFGPVATVMPYRRYERGRAPGESGPRQPGRFRGHARRCGSGADCARRRRPGTAGCWC